MPYRPALAEQTGTSPQTRKTLPDPSGLDGCDIPKLATKVNPSIGPPSGIGASWNKSGCPCFTSRQHHIILWEVEMAYRTLKKEEYDRRLLKVFLVTLAGLLGTASVPFVLIF